MKKAIVFSLLAMFISVTGLSTTVEAKRFGGGMSFGKSFKKQKSFSKPAPQQGASKHKAAPTQGAASGARAGGMMGILGGLAMGGLLGAMFFGGAFEGINFMDILLMGGIAFAIFWFMRRAANGRREEYAHAGHHNQSFGHSAEPQQPNAQQQATLMSAETSAIDTSATPDLDTDHFMQAAKDIFVRMQTDWDAKNIEDIRKFCTPDVAEHISGQLQSMGENTTQTEVVMLHAEIAGTWLESNLEWAAVHFQSVLKERTLNSDSVVVATEDTNINEVWVFQHNPNNDDPTWYLSGIQQV